MHNISLNYSFFFSIFYDEGSNMRSLTDEIMRKGGEGVILRQPQSAYQHGVSCLLLKYKNMIWSDTVITQSKIRPNSGICNQFACSTFVNSKLTVMTKLQFKTTSGRRIFFDEFAKTENFNPLDAKKWYSITQRKIRLAVSRILLPFSWI
jgi:hypothetical protein